MILDANQIGKDIIVFLSVSGGVMSKLAAVNEVLSTMLILTGLIYTVVRIIGQVRINRGRALDNKKKENEL
jgi:sorbitol-specific phosphotransferase system component IIC